VRLRGKSGGTPHGANTLSTTPGTSGFFIIGNDVMMSGSESDRSPLRPLPHGSRPPTRTVWLEIHDDHFAAFAALGSGAGAGYPISISQFCISAFKLSNGIFFGWSAKNLENELSVMRLPFVNSSFSATQYRTLAIGTEKKSATSLTLYPKKLSTVYGPSVHHGTSAGHLDQTAHNAGPRFGCRQYTNFGLVPWSELSFK
jgi:hypothetical protein